MSWGEAQKSATRELVRQVGAWIQAERRNFDRDQVETKSLNSLVSYVDRQAEISLIQGLQAILPDSGFLGEEGGTQDWVEGGFNWVIDPLDGTTNFIHNLPPYAISLALLFLICLVRFVHHNLHHHTFFVHNAIHHLLCFHQLKKEYPNASKHQFYHLETILELYSFLPLIPN